MILYLKQFSNNITNRAEPFLNNLYISGPRKHDVRGMLKELGYRNLDELTNAAVPDDIKLNRDMLMDKPLSEFELIKRIQDIADKNKVRRKYIGYYNLPHHHHQCHHRHHAQGVAELHRYGILQHLHPAHHPPEHVREPRLDNPVHTLPAGNCSGIYSMVPVLAD